MYYRRRCIKASGKRLYILPLLLFLVLLTALALFFRRLSIQIAVSDAVDLVNSAVNDSVSDIISEGDYGFDYFVDLSKDESGNITAIASNMSHINALSTEILERVMRSADDGTLNVGIPMGNLLGISLLTDTGPEINVEVVMLTSSRTDFKSVVQSAGINQSEYQLMLEVTIDIDVMVPWATESATTVTEVLIADTVIVGGVPQTYLNLEN